ncbi:PREDICTED: DNA cross-link repair 1A protein-like isoform X3 [Priapulus caudatus]|uniref:DNA cross-link repair 1A protein-like isoform X3 n=1 Tax=Priapulus caudatus TaxID=37621 RepID=A0ABM1E082_PRICU|nr:PREDICTED: DNA cross-link repair 1A protein-like isoform X3 [Priapulus caudatus]
MCVCRVKVNSLVMESDDESSIWEYSTASVFTKTDCKSRLLHTDAQRASKHGREKTSRPKLKNVVELQRPQSSSAVKKARHSVTRTLDANLVKGRATKTTDLHCPHCHLPQSALIGESLAFHANACMEKEVIATEECPDGKYCSSTIPSHFRRFLHQELANEIANASKQECSANTSQCATKGNGLLQSSSTVQRRSNPKNRANLTTRLRREPQMRTVAAAAVSPSSTSRSRQASASSLRCLPAGDAASSSLHSCCVSPADLDMAPDASEYLQPADMRRLSTDSSSDSESLLSLTKQSCQTPGANESNHCEVYSDGGGSRNRYDCSDGEDVGSNATQNSSETDDGIFCGELTQQETAAPMVNQLSSQTASQVPSRTTQRSLTDYFPVSYSKSGRGAVSVGSNRKPSSHGGLTSSRGRIPKTPDGDKEALKPVPRIGERPVTSMESEQTRKCPSYKKIPDTGFAVDAFNYGAIPGIRAYFLTHFHYDHTIGLSKHFTHGPIYCSKVTANMVMLRMQLDSRYIHVLPVDEECIVMDICVTLIDANHCPGAVMILFSLPTGKTILHTGDFRASAAMELHPCFRHVCIDTLYLDTTYCSQAHDFPDQQEVINHAVSLATSAVAMDPRTMIVCGTYQIGKEKVFVAIADALNSKISVAWSKRSILKCMEDPELMSKLASPRDVPRVHVVPMAQVTATALAARLDRHRLRSHFSSVLAFKPTGWTHRSAGNKRSLAGIKPVKTGKVSIVGIPYSEHSSFSELRRFVRFVQPQAIVTTVNNGSSQQRDEMQAFFKQWLAG